MLRTSIQRCWRPSTARWLCSSGLQPELAKHVEALITRHALLQEQVGSDLAFCADRMKELSSLANVADAHSELKVKANEMEELRELATDSKAEPELRALARDELSECEEVVQLRRDELIALLVPPDINDDGRGVVLEVRSLRGMRAIVRGPPLLFEVHLCSCVLPQVSAGVGGTEAGLFASELFEMYAKLARRQRWRFDSHQDGSDSSKELSASISGADAYGMLQVENGTHRVQRVPATEALGRVHTSTAVVVVLPEADATSVTEINEGDVIVETMKSSGSGGQSVNTTDSKVVLTHKPTGIKVSCQTERSQLSNRTSAWRMLHTRIAAKEAERVRNERSSLRNESTGTGARSERIRTYNFHDDRVTDHRLGVSRFGIPSMMSGDMLEEFVDELKEKKRLKRLELFLGQCAAGEQP